MTLFGVCAGFSLVPRWTGGRPSAAVEFLALVTSGVGLGGCIFLGWQAGVGISTGEGTSVSHIVWSSGIGLLIAGEAYVPPGGPYAPATLSGLVTLLGVALLFAWMIWLGCVAYHARRWRQYVFIVCVVVIAFVLLMLPLLQAARDV